MDVLFFCLFVWLQRQSNVLCTFNHFQSRSIPQTSLYDVVLCFCIDIHHLKQITNFLALTNENEEGNEQNMHMIMKGKRNETQMRTTKKTKKRRQKKGEGEGESIETITVHFIVN
jgi:hypothetical protein